MGSSPPAVRLVRLLCWGLDAWLRPFKGKSPRTKECFSLITVRVCPHAFRTLSKVKSCVYWACLVSQKSSSTFSFLFFSFWNLIFMAFLPGRLYSPPPFFPDRKSKSERDWEFEENKDLYTFPNLSLSWPPLQYVLCGSSLYQMSRQFQPSVS